MSELNDDDIFNSDVDDGDGYGPCPPAPIIINGEAAIVGPEDRLIIAMANGAAFTPEEIAQLSEILTERLGDRFVVLASWDCPMSVTVLRGGDS